MIVCDRCKKEIEDSEKCYSKIVGFKRKEYCEDCWIKIGEKPF